jgi:REP-associated tyrosine transposase
MYDYRHMTPEQRAEVLEYRRLHGYPLHEPPHLQRVEGWFLITAATFEHRARFATAELRLWLLDQLFRELQTAGLACAAWVVLPTHYHLMAECHPLSAISEPLRRVHARTARELNRREGSLGRQVWYRFSDRLIRNERHYYTTLNYIHYNPIKHGLVSKPLEWPCSSVHWYAEHEGIEWLRDAWREFPVKDYGQGWDW